MITEDELGMELKENKIPRTCEEPSSDLGTLTMIFELSAVPRATVQSSLKDELVICMLLPKLMNPTNVSLLWCLHLVSRSWRAFVGQIHE